MSEATRSALLAAVRAVNAAWPAAPSLRSRSLRALGQAPVARRYLLDPLVDAPLVSPDSPRVLQLVGEQPGPDVWRVFQPTRCLQLHGYPVDWAPLHDAAGLLRVPLHTYDAIVLCRAAYHRHERATALRWRDLVHRRGQRLWYECDDDLFTVFADDQQLRRGDRVITAEALDAEREAAAWMLTYVDGVTCSTQYLASTIRRFTTRPVEVVPNAIDADWFTSRQAGVPRPVPGPTVGWCGGGRPDSDLEAMAVAWGRIAQTHPDVTFVVAGAQPAVLAQHVPEARLWRLPWLPAEDYPALLVGIDVGCCPLEDRPFNRAKSPIKCWEYAMSGSAVVASPTVYGACIDQGVSGLVVETADGWEAGIAALLDHPEARSTLAMTLAHAVRTKWSLRKNAWRWPLAWSRLMAA
jgi:glycosyltransferase involved in cell wall biosynthesis